MSEEETSMVYISEQVKYKRALIKNTKAKRKIKMQMLILSFIFLSPHGINFTDFKEIHAVFPSVFPENCFSELLCIAAKRQNVIISGGGTLKACEAPAEIYSLKLSGFIPPSLFTTLSLLVIQKVCD